ncbi:hypothetical protein LWM68_30975 [Niabella sp. W65]|nr:hypothetical protein [Niabella sp. W65]MCH7366799.1 hypothetical protein [Niabella sp. W65]ULT42506.1 hypothetical protein KRR40_02530 [Niabella sp. I65]
MGWQDGTLLAYARLLPPGVSYAEQSIGRVVLKKEARKSGTGKLLMQESIARSYQIFGKAPIKIGAQYHLKNFMNCWALNNAVIFMTMQVSTILKW